jgi:hypothetical protein
MIPVIMRLTSTISADHDLNFMIDAIVVPKMNDPWG